MNSNLHFQQTANKYRIKVKHGHKFSFISFRKYNYTTDKIINVNNMF